MGRFLWKVTCEYIADDLGEWVKVPAMLIPGRTRDEAVMRAQAIQITSATNFEAYKVEYAQGFPIVILGTVGAVDRSETFECNER